MTKDTKTTWLLVLAMPLMFVIIVGLGILIGRFFFISVKWNFGKLNANKNRNATNAAFKMMY